MKQLLKTKVAWVRLRTQADTQQNASQTRPFVPTESMSNAPIQPPQHLVQLPFFLFVLSRIHVYHHRAPHRCCSQPAFGNQQRMVKVQQPPDTLQSVPLQVTNPLGRTWLLQLLPNTLQAPRKQHVFSLDQVRTVQRRTTVLRVKNQIKIIRVIVTIVRLVSTPLQRLRLIPFHQLKYIVRLTDSK